jgi:hypothetical protein
MNDKPQLPESPISINFRLRSPNGFEHQLTMRHGLTEEDFSEFMRVVVEKENILLKKGWTPIAQNTFGASKPPAVTKPCPTHPEEVMKEKVSKTSGKKYFSHSKGVYPNLTMCFGNGWQEREDQGGGY